MFYRYYRYRRFWRHWRYVLYSAMLILAYFIAFGDNIPFARKEPEIRLWDAEAGKTVQLPLEDYVAGVLAAEMPAEFELEALKAGAVTARTYAFRRVLEAQTIPGTTAHVSSDHRVSQAWLSPKTLLAAWGIKEYMANWPKIKLAVQSTKGQVLTYKGQLIQALYHSTSGGFTSNSEDYFTTPFPYLEGVASPWEKESPYWRTTVFVSYKELASRLSLGTLQAKDGRPLVEVAEHYATGRTKSVRIGDKIFPSRTVREKLGMRSAWFTVECKTSGVEFHLQGNGHGVGMSQYGANGLAKEGYRYAAILRHYYQGAQVRKLY